MTSKELKHRLGVGLSLIPLVGIIGAGVYDGRILPVIGAIGVSSVYVVVLGICRLIKEVVDARRNNELETGTLNKAMPDAEREKALRYVMRRNKRLVRELYSAPPERIWAHIPQIDPYRDENGIDREGQEWF